MGGITARASSAAAAQSASTSGGAASARSAAARRGRHLRAPAAAQQVRSSEFRVYASQNTTTRPRASPLGAVPGEQLCLHSRNAGIDSGRLSSTRLIHVRKRHYTRLRRRRVEPRRPPQLYHLAEKDDNPTKKSLSEPLPASNSNEPGSSMRDEPSCRGDRRGAMRIDS